MKVLFTLTAILLCNILFSQNSESHAIAFNPQTHYLTFPLIDTVRPIMCNCGKALLHYDCIYQKHLYKNYLFKYLGVEKSCMTEITFTEQELKILEQNLLFIHKQSRIQMQEWIRKDRWDLNLGEAIKGFYMSPMF